MNIQHLIQFLSKDIDANELYNLSLKQFSEYKQGICKSQSSIPISVENDKGEFELRLSHIKNIFECFLLNDFDKYFLNYIFDVIDLSETFIYDEEVEEIVVTLANPDINYPLNKKLIHAILEWINKENRENIDSFFKKLNS